MDEENFEALWLDPKLRTPGYFPLEHHVHRINVVKVWPGGEQEHSPSCEQPFPFVDEPLLQYQIPLDETVPLVGGALLLQSVPDLLRRQVGDVTVAACRDLGPPRLLAHDGARLRGSLALGRGRVLVVVVVVVLANCLSSRPGSRWSGTLYCDLSSSFSDVPGR